MRREVESDLPKLGQREYIQGGTIFNGALAVVDEVLGAGWLLDSRIPSFKLERESVSNGRYVLSDAPIGDVSANATLLLRTGQGEIHVVYIDEGRPFRREPYNEEQYNQPIRIGADLTGEFVLPGGRERVDFIKGVVGANKLVHQKTDRFGSGLEKVQFLYLKDLDSACLQHAGDEYQLAISNLTVKQTDTEVWTINRLTLRSAGLQSEFRLCYRAQRVK